MIKFKDLLRRTKTERIAVHTPTEEQAVTLLGELDKRGFKWHFGTKLTANTLYENYKENTYYDIDLNKEVWCFSPKLYQPEGYTIIEFKDIDFKEEL